MSILRTAPPETTKRIMAQVDEKFRDLVTSALAGSKTAIEELLRDYEPYLLGAIRRKLHDKLRPKFDSLDFSQDVWASFFAEPPESQAFEKPEDLVAYLTRLAHNKLIAAYRQRLVGSKYNVNREQSLADSKHFNKNALIGREGTPSQAISAEEAWAEFLRRQPVVYQRIFIMLREGKKSPAIAEELGLHTRTVQRIATRFPSGLFS
jgi:RNA polymerase sigma factor (sigma-70 family)